VSLKHVQNDWNADFCVEGRKKKCFKKTNSSFNNLPTVPTAADDKKKEIRDQPTSSYNGMITNDPWQMGNISNGEKRGADLLNEYYLEGPH
jgi:hypothetical protein